MLTEWSFIRINSTTGGSVLLNGAVNSKDHYDGIQIKPTTQHWLTVVNGTRSITWLSATLSSTGSAWPGQVKAGPVL